MMRQDLLPEGFRDLELFADWMLPKQTERRAKRLASSMDDIQAFYDAIFPRMPAIFEYLNGFALDQMPDDAQRLLQLCFSWIEVTSAVEIYKQPHIIEAVEPGRFQRVDEV